MLAARLARAPSGRAFPLGGRRPVLARRARLERAQEPADRARRHPPRAGRGRRLDEVLERLAADAEVAGVLEDAIRLSRRRVELDPLREDAHRELVRRL